MTTPEPDPQESVFLSGELERAVLGAEPTLSAQDVAEDAGATVEQARRLWRALGFPERGGEVAFTPADARAMRTLLDLVDTELIDFDTGINLTRGVGQTMARLADWEVSALVQRIEELGGGASAPAGSRSGSALRLVEQLNPSFERLLVYAWRRHLAAVVARLEALGAAEEDLTSVDVTVGFADLVAFTSLTNDIEEDHLGDLVELFESRCHDVVTNHGGRVIKSLGDSVLFVHDEPIQGIETAEGIIRVIGRDARMPDVRLGLATGQVVMRLGDVFGPPVNMAARLTNVARRNRVIIDDTTAAALPPDQFETRRLPARPVRGFGLVEPVAVRRH